MVTPEGSMGSAPDSKPTFTSGQQLQQVTGA